MPSPASMVKLMKALGLKTDDLIRASDPQAVEAINAKLSRKGGKPTEQDVFQEIARLNAAMPVQQGGLGMGVRNTAGQREKALGFDVDSFHGTTNPALTAFEKGRSVQKDSGWYGSDAVYSSPDPASASSYANYPNIKNNTNEMFNQNVLPLKIRRGNAFDYGDAAPMKSREESDNFTKLVRDKLGYETVVVPNKYADPKYASMYEIASFNPANIRSRFAAFDPARVNENNLLASRLLPFALPGLLALPTDEE